LRHFVSRHPSINLLQNIPNRKQTEGTANATAKPKIRS
jgi:hypothetical protein